MEPTQQHLNSLSKDEECVSYRSNQTDSASVLLLPPASQVAISLENVGLYSELQRSEAFLPQGERMCQTGSFGWNISSGEIYWSDGLGGHLKTGHRWTLQNRPTEQNQNKIIYNLRGDVRANIFMRLGPAGLY